MKNSPRQSNLAGPDRNTSSFHSTVWMPPGACTRRGELALPLWMEATAAAQEPVPDDIVSPTPRSQKRTSISFSFMILTNSTFIPCLKSSWIEICCAIACQPGSNSETNTTKCGLPIETGVPEISPQVNLIESGSPTSGTPMELRNSKLLPSRTVKLQVFRPAPVRMITESRLFCAQYQAATQRVPLPDISASEPSAFRRQTPRSASLAGKTHSTPSAPTPLCRSQMRRLNE